MVNPATNNPSIYFSIFGRGIQRVDGPLTTLESGDSVFCGACVDFVGVPSAQVRAVVPALAATIPLRLGTDGTFHGSVLFDSAKITSFDYHFEVNGKPTRPSRVNLTSHEIASGVATLTNARPPGFRGEIESHSQRAPGVVNVRFELTEVGEGPAQNVKITGISFETVRGKGSVTLDPGTASLLPILVGDIAEDGSKTSSFLLDVPASVGKFRMTVTGTLQDAIGRSFPFQITTSLRRDGGQEDDRSEI